MSSLSFNDFIETVILPDLVEKYESIIFPYLENFDRNFNDVYDAALVDRGEYPFNKTEAAKELYDLQMHGTYNKIHPTFREIIESCCDKFDDERTIAIARDPDNAYLSGFMSSYKLGKVWRITGNTPRKIHDYAIKRAREKTKFLVSRIRERAEKEGIDFDSYIADSILSDMELKPEKTTEGQCRRTRTDDSISWEIVITPSGMPNAISIKTNAIIAGGHNVQCIHERFLVRIKKIQKK